MRLARHAALLIDVVVEVLADAEHEWKSRRLTFTHNGDRHHDAGVVAPLLPEAAARQTEM